MRYDIFSGKKSVHVKLTKETHAALREKLFRHGMTMQDLFQEAAEMVLQDTASADKLIQRIFKKKMTSTLEKLDKKNRHSMGQFDSETLYNLLEAQDDGKTED